MPARKKRTQVVIDTNVMVSAALGGEARQVVNKWKFGFLQLVVSEEIVQEYLAVLARFDLTDAQMRHWTRWFTHPAKVTEVHPPLRVTVSRDPQDNRFLEAAVTGQAKYLITRDQDLLVLQEFEEVVILTPRAFLAVWQPRKRKRKASR